jgi:hypothetical protein
MINVGSALDVMVPRDVGGITLEELIDEGTLDVDLSLRKEVLGNLLTRSDGGEPTTMMRLAVSLWRIYSRVGAAEG